MTRMKNGLKKAKKQLYFILFAIVAIVIALSVTLFCLVDKDALKKNTADAVNTGTKGATLRYLNSSSTQLFDSSGNFNRTVVQNLFNFLVYGYNGMSGQKATLADVTNQLTESRSNYRYMSGATLRSRADASGGLAVYFAGSPYSSEKWQLVYVSRTTGGTAYHNGEVIATFWYNDNWTGITANYSDYKYACYGMSNLRNTCNSAANNVVNSTFRSTYFVQPKYVAWQYSQGNAFVSSSTSYTTYWPGSNSWGTTYTNVSDSSTSSKSVPTSAQMVAWKDDYYWIPSAGEVYAEGGPYNATEANGKGIWGLTSAQKGYGSATKNSGEDYYTWMRSAKENSKTVYYTITDVTGARDDRTYTGTARFRPAVHLNLTAMSKVLYTPVNVPSSFSRTYTGKTLSLSGLSWYDGSSSYYSSTVSISPSLSSMVAAGTYSNVAFTLASGNSQNCVWADTTSTGTKYITVTINKASLTVTSFSYNTSTEKITGISTSGAVNGESPPYAAFRIKYQTSSGGSLSSPYVKPTAAGTYRVVPELDTSVVANTASFKSFYNNYSVTVSSSCYQTITITNVEAPVSLSRTYTGTGIVITDASWYSASQTYYKNTSLMTVSPALSNIVNVGTYTVKFTLAANTSNILWKDTKNTGTKTVTFTVTKKTLTVTGFTYNESTKKVTGITTSGAVSGQSPSYAAFKYRYTTSTGGTLDKPYEKPLKAGKYRVYPEYDTAAVSGSTSLTNFYANYSVVIGSTSYQELTVVGIPEPKDITKVYTGSIVNITQESWYSSTYYGTNGYVGYTLTAKNAGEYYVSFALKNSTLIRWENGTDADITVKVTITKRPVAMYVTYGEDDQPHTEFRGVTGNSQSGVVGSETVPIKYEYYQGSNFYDSSNPNKRPSKKGDYRVYVRVDESVKPVNYQVGNVSTSYVDFHLEGITDPTDIHMTYNGKAVDLTKQTWYVEKYYGEGGLVLCPDVSNFIDCPLARSLPYYSATFRMKPESDIDWSSGNKSSQITIHIYIDPKPIDVYFIQNTETYALTVMPYAGEIELRDEQKPPVFAKRYVQWDEATKTEIADTATTVEPTRRGLYHVYPIISKKTGNTSNYNYDIKQPNTFTMFSVMTEVIKTPTVNDEVPTATYTGEEIRFMLSSATVKYMSGGKEARICEYEITEELEEQGVRYDSADYAFYAKEVGTYVVQFYLTSDDFMWDMLGGYMTFSIEKRGVTITQLDGLSDDQNANEDFDIIATHDVPAVDCGSIAFLLTYQREGEAPVSEVMLPVEVNGRYTNEVKTTLNFNKIGPVTVSVALAPVSVADICKNYVLTDTMSGTVTLRGKGAKITSDKLIWKYKNSMVETAVFGDVASVEYNTREYTVFLDQDALRQEGLKVKSYRNAVATKASVNGIPNLTYATLTAYDDSWEYIETEFEFKWTISKGLYDLTSVRWDYNNAFSYTGRTHQLYLQNLSGGLKATLIHASARDVGQYTAKVMFSSGDPNYEAPTQGLKNTYRFKATEERKDFQWEQEWEIKRAEVTPRWDMHGGTAINSDFIEVSYPTLYLLPEGAVKYTFYTMAGEELVELTNGAAGLRIVNGNETGYWVKAEIAADTEEDYASKYILADDKNNPRYFTVGENKIPVKISYTDPMLRYTGKGEAVDFEVLPANPEETRQVPLKGSFDVMFYNEGEVYSSEEEAVPTNIGVYEVRFELKDTSSREYYIQGKTSFTYTILRAKTDLTKLSWNYEADRPYVFGIDGEGNAKTYSVELSGFEKKAYTLVYELDEEENVRNESAEVGKYTAKFDIVNLDEVNYEPVTLNDIPESLRTLEWEIVPYTIEAPKTDANVTFDGAKHNLCDLIGLPVAYERYMTVTMKYANQIIHDPMVMDAGDYKVECTLDPMLAEAGKIRWTDGNWEATHTGRLSVSPLVIVVKDWQTRAGQSPVPVFVNEPESSLYLVEFYYDGEQLHENELKRHLGEKMTAQVVPSPNYPEGDVIVSSTADGTVAYDFYLFSKAAKAVMKPTLASERLYYNGRMQQFNVIGFDGTYMEYVGNSTLQRKELGEDTITIRLKGYQNVKWSDGTTGDLVLTYGIIRGKLTPAWNKNGAPTLSVTDEYEDAIEYVYYDAEERTLAAESLIHGKPYTVLARIKPEYMNYFTIDGSSEITLDFIYQQPGLVIEDPNLLREVVEMPVWQVAVTGVSGVLVLFFTLMTMSYAATLNRAVQKTRKLAQMTYGALPVLPMLAIKGWLGMNEFGWTILSLSMTGLAFVMLIVMLVYRKKSIKAMAKLSSEQLRMEAERAAMEAERRREEERIREEELKAMLAGLQSNYNSMANDMQSVLTGNVQQMIEGTVAAALPAMQQQMQALPSAGAEYRELKEVIAKHEGMLSALISGRQEQGYTEENEEYEALCKRIAKAREEHKDGEEAVDEYEELKEIIAYQERMIDSLMDERRMYEAEQAESGKESAEKKPMKEQCEMLDEAVQGMYKELREYIAGKENVVEIEGKYAVLYKYRGKSAFKLSVKECEVQFSYVLDNGMQAEIPVKDEVSLEEAKQTVTLRMKRMDRNAQKEENK